ncbi:MAG: NYN domain-containing protein [Spiribacter salinus]|uniref:NYN domain-containing protein n=1 Tax=Spiribacter salinus TaxID=1335746 RepID=A0A540VQQ6_9GAMM|nr:MAG: NYN domain-containing protein [Spiribacter salinus]
MSFPPRFAVLIDGGFMLKKLKSQSHDKRFPTAEQIDAECERLRRAKELADLELLRIYFYHAPPSKDELTNPLDQTVVKLGDTNIHRQNEALLDRLELRPSFALRLGETVTNEWKLGDRAMRNILKEQRPVSAGDLVPNVQQKGVDLRIGLDIARLALRQMVSVLVVVTGDSDLVPAFKFARREGLRVYLDHMGHGVRRDLKAHVDLIL